jgi:hypothetical protein
MNDRAKVASAEYATIHNGKSYPLHGNHPRDERSKSLSLQEAQKERQEWIALDVAEVLQILWN